MAQGFGKVIPDDGLLDIIVASPKDTISGLSVLSSLSWSAVMSSNSNNNDLAYFRADQIKIELNESQKLVIDGEILDAQHVMVTVNSRALQVVAPIPLKS